MQPTLTPEVRQTLAVRAEKKARTPRFRRHEWWRYVKLGGKNAGWRVPRGIHSKTRRHWGYRPPVVSIGYRGPALVRGLHPSGFQEVLVHNVAELAPLDKATQAARLGGTVGGRKAAQIEKRAAELGIRVLNPRRERTEEAS
ncbi:MAG: 50S ribosomal protein L32e [Thermoplasmatota archaeon]